MINNSEINNSFNNLLLNIFEIIKKELNKFNSSKKNEDNNETGIKINSEQLIAFESYLELITNLVDKDDLLLTEYSVNIYNKYS